MKRTTRAGLLARLERLECRAVAREHSIRLRFGNLKQLPHEYQGERHVIVARELPNRGDQEWVEFEEVSGPDQDLPQQPARGIPDRLDVRFVEPYPWPEDTGEPE